MLKKIFEYLLILAFASALTLGFYLFLAEANSSPLHKSRIQVTLENVSHKWNDLFYSDLNKKQPADNVVVLAIDEPSVIEIGRWPWSRTVINEITQQLLKYDIKTLSYDIIFSEEESAAMDNSFATTVSKAPDKLILGTFSDYSSRVLPYQDYCLTQAFLYTGGSQLVKINPFLLVEDDTIVFEETPFNQLFTPLFSAIDQTSQRTYLNFYSLESSQQLSRYQLNTLNFFKKQKIYEYCSEWLTAQDNYSFTDDNSIQALYFKVFETKTAAELNEKLSLLKTTPVLNTIPQYEMWTQNIPALQEAAIYTASFVASPDADGVIRNYPLLFRTGNQLGTSYIPSLALQAYLASTGYQAIFKLKQSNGQKNVSQIEIQDVSQDSGADDTPLVTTLPVNPEGKMLINYYGKQNTIPYISAKELLHASDRLEYSIRIPQSNGAFLIEKRQVDKAEFLKDKNIIFGATAVGIYDIRTTPHDINYPGPEIHATALSNLLSQNYLRYFKDELRYAPWLLFLTLIISLLIFIKAEVLLASIAFSLTAIILVLLQRYLYHEGYLFHSSFLFLVLVFTSFFASLIYKYFFQSRKSKEIKKAFSKYVSKDVVEEILKNESAIELRGQKLFMSVYFSDIRGFTEFSEKMDPLELSELLNKYFTPMSAVITQHQGTIDKYIGDAVMAMFGAPINYKNHAHQACYAALGCLNALEKLNEEFVLRNWPKIDIGIGINTGYMNAGNIGSETIQNYTVIGDSVNLASRLESLNKNYGTHIIISEFTYEIVKDNFNCKELDTVNVKGKKEPVKIYELLSTK
ncbi:adenylate/guanylate cyclase domain-containing protein [Pseudobdellovibrio exovorus]|uniref:Adenylate cyclase n=1 Tax=Pseudobdellovibrio exovorus JSS TaxID=1184267 RepID=M4VBA2_9BACT|nr:adenylate/guanylate cyclase domain-containing protein [Pseudobdellovibrio exovorus]AGH95306.1 adenylate cyclase [Pseudobdellovibrio exovorus JSS]